MKVELRKFDTAVPAKKPSSVREKRSSKSGGTVWTVDATDGDLGRSMLWVFEKSVKKAAKKASKKNASKRTSRR